jgi:hypothetical protein
MRPRELRPREQNPSLVRSSSGRSDTRGGPSDQTGSFSCQPISRVSLRTLFPGTGSARAREMEPVSLTLKEQPARPVRARERSQGSVRGTPRDPTCSIGMQLSGCRPGRTRSDDLYHRNGRLSRNGRSSTPAASTDAGAPYGQPSDTADASEADHFFGAGFFGAAFEGEAGSSVTVTTMFPATPPPEELGAAWEFMVSVYW